MKGEGAEESIDDAQMIKELYDLNMMTNDTIDDDIRNDVQAGPKCEMTFVLTNDSYHSVYDFIYNF